MATPHRPAPPPHAPAAHSATRSITRAGLWSLSGAVALAAAFTVALSAVLVLLLLGLFVTAVTRTGLWFIGEVRGEDATILALRAGRTTLLAGLALTSLLQLLGPATVLVLAAVIGLTCVYLLHRRHARDLPH